MTPKPWARWWLWLWGGVALALIALIFVLSFKWWSMAALAGFGSMEAMGLVSRNDEYPPLTHVIRRFVPRWVAFTAIYGVTGAAGAVWLELSDPARLGLLFALLGWFTTHFDVAFDESKCRQESAKYAMLRRGAARALGRK